jgi:alkylation response protein AidB-like acyl-CoA dehydrogenase
MQKNRRLSDKLFSDIWLPEETQLIKKEVRDIAESILAPIAHRLNTTPESVEGFPYDAFNALSRAGIYTLAFPEEFGGRGLKYPILATMTAMEELAYFAPGLTSAIYDAQTLLVGKSLQANPGPMRDEWLPKLVRGEFVGSFATSEPAASTDLSVASIQTRASLVDGAWRVNGRKRWITNSPVADLCLTLCRTDNSLTMLAIDLHAEGVGIGAPDRKMGNYAQLTADITFNDVRVPKEGTIGETGKGLRVALGALALGRIGIGAVGTGMAQAAFDYGVAHMENRSVFGQKLAQFQHWQFSFANHAIGIENARSLYQKAAYRYDLDPASVEPQAAMAKIVGSETAVDVARSAIQVCGAYGFVRELAATGETFPLESIYRDAKIGEIYEGANEIQRLIIARSIFGRGLVG